MSGATYIAIGVLSTASFTVTTYFTKKNLETMLQTVRFFPRRLVRWTFFPACGAVVLSVFLVCLGTAKVKTAILEFLVALSFKFHLLKKFK